MIKLFDSEIKVMEVLWREGSLTAGQIVKQLQKSIGWNRNTTYTVIKKCIEKGAIERKEPKFTCKPLITKEEVQTYEVAEVIHKLFDGSANNFFATFFEDEKISPKKLKELHKMIDDLK